MEINGFEAIPAVSATPYFIISEDEKPKFRTAVARFMLLSGKQSVVGFYRSNVRAGMRLTEEDLILIKEFFQHPSKVFLVIGSGDGDEQTAGFFFWDKGSVLADMTFMPFPFDERLLMPHSSELAQGTKPAQGEVPQVFMRIESPRQQSHFAALKVRVPRWWARAQFATLCVPAIAVTVLGAFLIIPKLSLSNNNPQARGMMLAATLFGNQIVVSWDVNLPTISDAREGVLTIRDRIVRRELPLTKSMLNARNLVYTAVAEAVQVELEVISTAGKSTRETVLVLLNHPDQERAQNGLSIPSVVVAVLPYKESFRKQSITVPKTIVKPIPTGIAPGVTARATEQSFVPAIVQSHPDAAAPPAGSEPTVSERPSNLVSRLEVPVFLTGSYL